MVRNCFLMFGFFLPSLFRCYERARWWSRTRASVRAMISLKCSCPEMAAPASMSNEI